MKIEKRELTLKDLVIEILNKNPMAYRTFSYELRSDLDLLKTAMENNVYTLYFAPREIQNNWELLELLNEKHKEHYNLIEYADNEELPFTMWLENRLEYLNNL